MKRIFYSIVKTCLPEAGKWITLNTDACLSASWFGCGDGLQFQRKMMMKCFVNNDVEKVYDTRIFPKSGKLPMPHPRALSC